MDSNFKQQSITTMFKKVDYNLVKITDIEDIKPSVPMIPSLLLIKNPPNFVHEFQNWLKVLQPAWSQRRKRNLAL